MGSGVTRYGHTTYCVLDAGVETLCGQWSVRYIDLTDTTPTYLTACGTVYVCGIFSLVSLCTFPE